MAKLLPSTSEEIASAANLNERYVREWLGATVVGGIVEGNPEDGTYHPPQERAAFLTRAASPNNTAAQFIPVLALVEDEVVESFEHGGVPYSAYPRFHGVMAEDSGQPLVSSLLDSILPLVRSNAAPPSPVLMPERPLGAELRYSWTIWTAMEPSPTAEATRLTEPCLTSPTAKTPDMLVSSNRGRRPMCHPRRGRP